jgi:hypothetical protein
VYLSQSIWRKFCATKSMNVGTFAGKNSLYGFQSAKTPLACDACRRPGARNTPCQ